MCVSSKVTALPNNVSHSFLNRLTARLCKSSSDTLANSVHFYWMHVNSHLPLFDKRRETYFNTGFLCSQDSIIQSLLSGIKPTIHWECSGNITAISMVFTSCIYKHQISVPDNSNVSQRTCIFSTDLT